MDFWYKLSMSTAETLKGCMLFQGFSDAGLTLLSKICRKREFRAKTPIFVENMVSDGMFVIAAGVVELTLRTDDGREPCMEELFPGDFFGELSLLIGGNRMVTASAKTDCELIEIPRREFVSLQNKKPQACLKLMINIVNHFGKKAAGAREHLKPLLLSQLQ
jgi:CRP-like cAMP-binding protein